MHNRATTAAGVAVLGPDSVFNQVGGQISFNAADMGVGGMLIGNTGTVTVTITGGLIFSNSAPGVPGQGGISIDRGSLVITGSRILSNSSSAGGAALFQWAPTGPVSVTVANSCLKGNGPITSVVNSLGPTINARGNWWGAADGPSGVGPGSGDSVSSGVDYSSFLSVPPVPGCPAPLESLTVARDGTGAGSVASTPAGITCGGACNQSYYENTVVTQPVTLTATFNKLPAYRMYLPLVTRAQPRLRAPMGQRPAAHRLPAALPEPLAWRSAEAGWARRNR